MTLSDERIRTMTRPEIEGALEVCEDDEIAQRLCDRLDAIEEREARSVDRLRWLKKLGEGLMVTILLPLYFVMAMVWSVAPIAIAIILAVLFLRHCV